MKISAKGRYALRLMIDLAQHDTGDWIALRDVSARQEISVKYLEQIVTPLSSAGFVMSTRGAKGGYRLARRADSYTVGDILRVIEGKIVPVACMEQDVNACSRYATCPTIGFWQGLSDVINRYLDGTTLLQLAEENEKVPLNYSI